jgi:hypothetical protein
MIIILTKADLLGIANILNKAMLDFYKKIESPK